MRVPGYPQYLLNTPLEESFWHSGVNGNRLSCSYANSVCLAVVGSSLPAVRPTLFRLGVKRARRCFQPLTSQWRLRVYRTLFLFNLAFCCHDTSGQKPRYRCRDPPPRYVPSFLSCRGFSVSAARGISSVFASSRCRAFTTDEDLGRCPSQIVCVARDSNCSASKIIVYR